MVDQLHSGSALPSDSVTSEPSPTDHVLIALDTLRTDVVRRLDEAAERVGQRVRGSEARLLHLIEPGGTRPTALGESGWITKQAISKRLKGMAERGLVVLEADPSDGRAILVRRTPAGDRLLEFTVDQIARLEAEFAESVGPDRYQRFRETLDELLSPVPRP